MNWIGTTTSGKDFVESLKPNSSKAIQVVVERSFERLRLLCGGSGGSRCGQTGVALGGHDVPSDVVKRRFGRSLGNFFKLYAPLANEWALFDNSSSPQALPVATQYATQLTVTEATTWRKLQRLSKVV